MKPVSLFGQGVRSISDVVTRQRRLNCFYSVRVDGDRSAVVILGSPGSFVKTTLPEFPIWGFRVVGNSLFAVAGKSLYEIAAGGGVTNRGAIPTANGYVSMADNGFDIIITDGIAGYVYKLSTHVVSTISDTNFPNGAGSVVFLGERYIAPLPNSRQWRVSAQLDGMTWTPQIFATKEDYSDNIVAVDSFLGTLIFWASFDIEFWQNAGTSPNPFQKVTGATQTWGLAAKMSRAVLGQSIAFLGQNPDGGVQIMRLSGLSVTRISTEDVENEIRKFSNYADAVALTYTVNGHSFYQISFLTAQRSFVFDSSTNVWHEAQTGIGVTGRHYAQLGAVFNAVNYFSDSTSGNVYQFDLDLYTDNGVAIKRQIATKHVRSAGNTLDISELYLDMEVGVGNSSVVEPVIMLQVSRDGGKNFGPQRFLSLGVVGDYTKRVITRRLGSGRDFVFLITMTDPAKFVIASGSAVVDVESE